LATENERVPGLSCGVVYLMLSLDRQLDDDRIYHASIASGSKKFSKDSDTIYLTMIQDHK